MSIDPTHTTRVVVAEDPDGSQVLLWLWEDGTLEISRRPRDGDVWGPPLQIVEDDRS